MLGYDNNRGSMPKRPTVYSPYSMINPTSEVDPSRLSFAFWNKLIKLTISPKLVTGNDNIEWDKEHAISAHLTHTKAAILANEIRLFLKDPITYNSDGVISNETLVTISNGSEFGKNGSFLVIRKLNVENADTLSSYAYEFNSQFHHSIRNFNEKERTFDTAFDDYAILEIEQLLMILDEYVKAMTYAISFSVLDQMDYRMNGLDNKLSSIADKLGVNYEGGGSYRSNKSNNSVFNKAAAANKSKGAGVTLDDLEEDMFAD